LPNNIYQATLDKFDPKPINVKLVNVNKLKPYQFLDDETHTIDCLELVYQEGHKDGDMDNKNKDNNEEPFYMVHIA
jgi:hypothetical protein